MDNPLAQLVMKRVLTKLGLGSGQQAVIMSVAGKLAASPEQAQQTMDKLCASGLVTKDDVARAIEDEDSSGDSSIAKLKSVQQKAGNS